MTIFCRCITCGAEAPLPKGRPAPDDWVAFHAAHWPAGTDMGALFLRMCGRCKAFLDREGVIDPHNPLNRRF